MKWRRMGNICLYTNLDYPERHEDMILYKRYTPEEYPQYINCNAIEVSHTERIPEDYYGIMGVPITFLAKHNPEQFDILGIDKNFTSDGGRFKLIVNGKEKTQYARLVIRRKSNGNQNARDSY